MVKIYFEKQHQTILFAISELQRYIHAQIEIVYHWSQFPQFEEGLQIVVIDELSYKQFFNTDFFMSKSKDCYSIIQQQQTYFIIAKNPRGLLYGVYGFWQHILGLVSLELGETEVSVGKNTLHEKLDRTITHEPQFARRGNVLETINDEKFVSSLIDWGVKNGHNEYFFTFFLWDELKATIEPLLAERAVDITLGGHSLRYIIAQCTAQQEHLSSRALDGEVGDLIGTKTAFTNEFTIKNSHFFEQGNPLQQLVIDYIVETCQQTPLINRISLWPEDVGINRMEAKRFMQQYILFTDNLQLAILDARLEVQVEHIVYNAGLKWEMLERGEAKASATADVLYAYWGRNYAKQLNETEDGHRANIAINDWRNETKNGITIFEYYSDHYMLSELFPPLFTRIRKDLSDYQSTRFEGVINLIVPLHKHTQLQWPSYNWRWIQHINNVIYSRLAWGECYEQIIADYFKQFGEREEYYKQLLLLVEQQLAPLTKWNRVLFPYRVVDVQHIKSFDESIQIADQLKQVIELLLPVNQLVGHNETEKNIICYLNHLKEIASQLEKNWRVKAMINEKNK